MEIKIREFKQEDEKILPALLNGVDKKYLTDRIPVPYTDEDAKSWVNYVLENEGDKGLWRLIEVDGVVVGSISVEKHGDVRYEDGEIGYYLLEPYNSQGIMTKALSEFMDEAYEKMALRRLSASVFAPNTPSRRVLEKNGFTLEGVRNGSITKNGHIYDECLYGRLKADHQ